MITILGIAIVILFLGALWWMQKKHLPFYVRVLSALGAGALFGFGLNAIAQNGANIEDINLWVTVVGDGYVNLLQLLIVPVIFVSIASAILRQQAGKNIGKITALIIAVLLGTNAIAATVGGLTANAFHLSSQNLSIGEDEKSRQEKLETRAKEVEPVQTTITAIIPRNALYAMSGQGKSPTLSVALIATLVGLAIVGIRKKKQEEAELAEKVILSFHAVVMRVVTMVMRLTPYGIFALTLTSVSGSDNANILRLILFVIASYLAIFIMFVIHGVLLALFGFSPLKYVKKAWSVLSFAFISRTSAGALPMTTQTLNKKMGVEEGVSNLAATLGTTIGQNGCAGIYPAMLVMMVAPVVGKEITPSFFITMVLVTTVTSIGIAGVGGGATIAGITVLSALGLPVGVAGLLISVEPMIDMARTALNVSDSIVAGLITGKITNTVDKTVYNGNISDDEVATAI